MENAMFVLLPFIGIALIFILKYMFDGYDSRQQRNNQSNNILREGSMAQIRSMADSFRIIRNSSRKIKIKQNRKNVIDFNICKYVLSLESDMRMWNRKSEQDVTIDHDVEDGIVDGCNPSYPNNICRSQRFCSISLCNLEEGNALAKSEFPQVSNCKHEFHYDCLQTWLTKHDECPICRQNMLVHDVLSQFDNPSQKV